MFHQKSLFSDTKITLIQKKNNTKTINKLQDSRGILKSLNFRGYLFISIVAFAVYANSLGNEFVFDDESVVQGDQSITQLSNIPKFFTAQEGFHKVIGRYYRPVVSTSYAIDYYLWGLNPSGFHLTNVLINLINSLLVFKFLLLLFGRLSGKISEQNRGLSKKVFYLSLIGVLIFAVHPVHTEAVSWVSGRTDSLSFTFFITSFICYQLISKQSIHLFFYYFLMFFFFVLSLLAKEMAITLPVIVIARSIREYGSRACVFLFHHLGVSVKNGGPVGGPNRASGARTAFAIPPPPLRGR